VYSAEVQKAIDEVLTCVNIVFWLNILLFYLSILLLFLHL
jgi:hypothetical protein